MTVLAATAAACVVPEADPNIDVTATEEAVTTQQLSGLFDLTLRLQAGTRLATYGVTDDGFVIFQDGGTIYAALLLPNAPRIRIADVGDIQPAVMIVGRVVFVWTTEPYFGNGSVSPLVVWSRAGGPQLAAESSLAGILATRAITASLDGREVVFVANVTPNGAVGDLVAAAPDMTRRRTLAAGISLAASCRPLAGFDGQVSPTGEAIGFNFGRRSIIAAYCLAGQTTATLVRWDGDERVDLQNGLPATPFWSSNATGSRFATVSSATPGTPPLPVSITAAGRTTVLENTPAGQTFFNYDGSTIALTTAATGNELHRYKRGSDTPEVLASFGPGFPFRGHFVQGYRQYWDPLQSADGNLFMFTTGPRNGDINLLDISTSPSRTIQLEFGKNVAQSFELFTADSRSGLYYRFDPPAFNPTLFAGSFERGARQVSSGAPNEFAHFALHGSDIIFSDNLNGTGIDLFDIHDAVLADVDADEIKPRVIASQIYNLYFPVLDRRAIIYTSDADPKSQGLFIKLVR